MNKIQIHLTNQQTILIEESFESIYGNLEGTPQFLTVISSMGIYHINKQNIAYILEPKQITIT